MGMKKPLLFKTIIPIITVCLFFFTSCGKSQTQTPPEQEENKFQLVDQVKTDKTNPFYIDAAAYPPAGSPARQVLPVGVFDSGTGGLTVLDSILKMDRFNNKTHEPGSDGIPDFDTERFVYLGDSANMPYGRYDGEGKSNFLRELIIKDTAFLLGRRYYGSPGDKEAGKDKDPAKAVVIACNTATAFGLDTVRNAVGQWGTGTRVLGIIDAGARTAVSTLPGGGKEQIIGIMATEGTCASGGYPGSVKKEFAKRFPGEQIALVQQPGFGLAAAIDGDIDYIDPNAQTIRDKSAYKGPGISHPRYPVDVSLWDAYRFDTGNALLVSKDKTGHIVEVQLNSVNNYIKYHVTHLVANAAKHHPQRRLGAVILGCTHYPFFEKELKEHFVHLKALNDIYNKIIPDKLTLVDPSRSLAKELYLHLKDSGLLYPGGKDRKPNGFYISVPNTLLKDNRVSETGEFLYAFKYGRSINSGLQFVKRVPFSAKWIKKEVLDRIKAKMPDIYNMFTK
jgi:glutamate racemase